MELEQKTASTKFKEEKINHPPHYNRYPIEAIDMMLFIWGKESTINFCLMNAFKYRMRLGLKGDNLQDDLDKESWYLNMAHLLTVDMYVPNPSAWK